MSRIAEDLASSPHSPFVVQENLKEQKRQGMNRLCIGKLPRVAVIGAGVSGLRCADLLTQAGAQVTIFEARNRIGGRVHQVENGGYLVDTGSNWIHGTEGNPIMTLAQETKTVLKEPGEESVVIDKDGKTRSPGESRMLSAEFWETILKAFKHSDANSADIDVNTSLSEWLEQEWTEKFSKDPDKAQDLIAESKNWSQFVGSPIEQQSLKFFFLEEGLDGENLFVAGTYQKILAAIAKPALARSDLRLNTEINRIEYRSEDMDVPVKVSTTQGDTFTFDEVVVTCPLGWLKQNHTKTFTPSLPPRLTQAISSIGYGALEKLYVSFPSPFWLGKSNDLSSWPGFTHFHNPAYHPLLPTPSTTIPTTWNQSVLSLSHLPEPVSHPTLLFYMTGSCGAYLTTLAHKHTPHSTQYNTLLHSFAEPFYSHLPNYDPSSPACTPTSFYLTTWQHDPLAGNGSYSTFRTGLTEADKDIETMRDAGGLSDEGAGLWLAGEHTAPFVALGTTTGAWWSGEGVARRIAKQYGLEVSEDRFSKGHGENHDGGEPVMKQQSDKEVVG